MSESIRIGSRGSQLALWQANHIAAELRAAGHAVEIEVIRTTGDRMQQPGYSSAGAPQAEGATAPADGKGIFIKEIEEALEAGRIDLAVHSLKDLPTELAPQFHLAAIPVRADARDVWVCEQYWALHTLPMGGRVGTTSPRRRAMLLALRPDLEFVETRGNIDTRLRKLEQGTCDALVLAAAGLDRLNRAEWVHQRFAVDEMCPAPGQGALALEMRAIGTGAFAGDGELALQSRLAQVIATLDDPTTRYCVEVERTVLHALGGGCQLPIGAFCAPISDGTVVGYKLQAQVVAPDGEQMIHLCDMVGMGVEAAEFGSRVAADLKRRGALDLLAV